MRAHKFQVTNYAQSPMNKRRWLCRLACGCEQWETRRTRPILGTSLVPCWKGCKPQGDPMPNGLLMLDVSDESPTKD